MKIMIVGIFLLGCTAVGVAAADARAGKAAYDKSCKSCHGADGSGNPAVAKMMKVELEHLDSKEVQARSDSDLRKVITDGKGKMKPVAAVTGSAVDDVVAYLRAMKK